jgi:hypothetical protein
MMLVVQVRSVMTNSRNIREFFLTPDGDQIAGRRKAIEVMRQQRVQKRIIDAQVKKMKLVSYKNQNKRPDDWAAAEAADWEVEPAAVAVRYNSKQRRLADEELEDVHMFEEEDEEGEEGDDSNHFDLR